MKFYKVVIQFYLRETYTLYKFNVMDVIKIASISPHTDNCVLYKYDSEIGVVSGDWFLPRFKTALQEISEENYNSIINIKNIIE